TELPPRIPFRQMQNRRLSPASTSLNLITSATSRLPPLSTTTPSGSAFSQTSPGLTRTVAAPSTSSPQICPKSFPAQNSPPSSRPSTASLANRTPPPSVPRPTPPQPSASAHSMGLKTPTSAPHTIN